MLDCLPIYHWFHCGNPYSGAQGGMRYLVAPAKKADPADESGKRKIEYLTATIWPGPWSLEHTADEKQEMAEFPGNQEGLDAAVAWLHERYESEPDKWAIFPPFWTVNRINKQISKQRPTGTLKPSGAIFLSGMK